MSDIIHRLEQAALSDPHDERAVIGTPLLRDAAAEIAKLRGTHHQAGTLPMSDIIRRLEQAALSDPHDERAFIGAPLLRDAAAEIAKLRGELAAMQQLEARDAEIEVRKAEIARLLESRAAARADLDAAWEAAAHWLEKAHEMQRERDTARATLKEICAEWNEGCDPACDSAGHSPTCKATSIAVAKRALQTERDTARALFERGCYNLMLMMQAYERRVRSDCTTPEQISARPWECAEYVEASRYLRKVWPIDAALKEGER